MTPQTKANENETIPEPRLEEQSLQFVEDHSLPAKDVLTDQHESSAPDKTPAVFVP